MSDVRYVVEIDYLTRGNLQLPNQLVGKMGEIDSLTEGLTSKLGSVGSAFGGIASSIVAAGIDVAILGATAAVGGLIYAVAGLNNELEQTQIGLAAVFQRQGFAQDMNQGMAEASTLMDKMRKDAAALPGEFKDLVGIFQTIANTGYGSGMTTRQLESFAAKTMAAGAIAHMPMHLVGPEMAQLLAGTAHSRNLLWQRMGMSQEMNVHDFNKLSSSKRRQLIEANLPDDEMIKTFQRSFEGGWTTIIDNSKRTVSGLASHLFDSVKGVFNKVNDWYSTNGEAIAHWAEHVGDRIATGFEIAVGYAEKLAPLMKRVADYMEHGDIAGDLKKLAIGGTAFGAGAAGLGLAGSIGAAAGAAGLPALPFTAIIDAGMIADAIALHGALTALTDATSKYHREAVKLWEDIETGFGGAMDKIRSAWEELKPATSEFSEWLGVTLMGRLKSLITGINDVLSMGIRMLEKLHILTPESSTKTGVDEVFERHNRGGFGLANNGASFGIAQGLDTGLPPKLVPDFLDKQGKTNFNIQNHTTNIHQVNFNITQTSDPSRIARLTVDQLNLLARHPKRAQLAPNFGKLT